MRTSLRPRMLVCVFRGSSHLAGRHYRNACSSSARKSCFLNRARQRWLFTVGQELTRNCTSKKARPNEQPAAAHAVWVAAVGETLWCTGAGLWTAPSLYLLAENEEPEDYSQFLCSLSQKASDNSFIKPTPIPDSHEEARHTTFVICVKTSFPLNVSIKLTLLAAPASFRAQCSPQTPREEQLLT